MNIETIITEAATWGIKLVGGIVCLIVGLYLIKKVMGLTQKQMTKKGVDVTLTNFLTSIGTIALKVLLVITIASLIGIPMTSFIAVIGAAGLAIGLALEGSLSNFAGGVVIILMKPFEIGDFIEGGGYSGVVKSIQIFHTILKTGDNKNIIIPNGELSNAGITNYSKEAQRRVDLTIGVAYDSDIKKVQSVLFDIIGSKELIKTEPEPFVRLTELADSSINFTIRVWVDAGDYWPVHFDLLESIKIRFDEEEIEFPYPHVDVTMVNNG